jgi:hypothetical protein
MLSLLSIGEEFWDKATFKPHSSHGALSSSLPIGEDPLRLQVLEFFASLSIYKTSIVFLGGQRIH